MKNTLVALLSALIVATSLANAGTTGVMNGYLRTDKGVPLAGATIKIISASRATSTRTDARGFFAFVDLPPDNYTLSAEATLGYRGEIFGVMVHGDQTVFIPLMVYSNECPTSYLFRPQNDTSASAFESIDVRALANYPPTMRSIAPQNAKYTAQFPFRCI